MCHHYPTLTRGILEPLLRPRTTERQDPGPPEAHDLVKRMAARNDRFPGGGVVFDAEVGIKYLQGQRLGSMEQTP